MHHPESEIDPWHDICREHPGDIIVRSLSFRGNGGEPEVDSFRLCCLIEWVQPWRCFGARHDPMPAGGLCMPGTAVGARPGKCTLPSRAAVIELPADTPAVDLDQLHGDLQQAAAVAGKELMRIFLRKRLPSRSSSHLPREWDQWRS